MNAINTDFYHNPYLLFHLVLGMPSQDGKSKPVVAKTKNEKLVEKQARQQERDHARQKEEHKELLELRELRHWHLPWSAVVLSILTAISVYVSLYNWNVLVAVMNTLTRAQRMETMQDLIAFQQIDFNLVLMNEVYFIVATGAATSLGIWAIAKWINGGR